MNQFLVNNGLQIICEFLLILLQKKEMKNSIYENIKGIDNDLFFLNENLISKSIILFLNKCKLSFFSLWTNHFRDMFTIYYLNSLKCSNSLKKIIKEYKQISEKKQKYKIKIFKSIKSIIKKSKLSSAEHYMQLFIHDSKIKEFIKKYKSNDCYSNNFSIFNRAWLVTVSEEKIKRILNTGIISEVG